MRSKSLVRDSTANASFAFAAVFILLAVTGFGVVMAQGERSAEDMLAAKAEAETVQRLPHLLASEVEIVAQSAALRILSISNHQFNLSTFQREMDDAFRQHFSENYPAQIGPFTVNVSISQVSTSLASYRDSNSPNAPVPGGIIVSLQLSVSAESEKARYQTTVDVTQEVQTPVPYLANQIEFIDQSSNTNGKIGRMVKSILSQLAQLRAIQGFGAPGHRPGLGVGSIITAGDVEYATNLALAMIEMSEFGTIDPLSWEALLKRSANDAIRIKTMGDWFIGDVDPFKTYMLLRGDHNDSGVNLRDFATQVLYSLFDQIIVRYLEYTHLIDITDCTLGIKSLMDDGWHAFVIALTGIDPRVDETIEWVQTVFERLNVPESAWRSLFNDPNDVGFDSDPSTVYIHDRVGRLTPISIGGTGFSIDMPEMSILRADAWRDFAPIFSGMTVRTGEAVENVVSFLCMELSNRIPADLIAPSFSSPEPIIQEILRKIQERIESLDLGIAQIRDAPSTLSPYSDDQMSLRNYVNDSWTSIFPFDEAKSLGKMLIAEKLSDTAVTIDPASLPDDWKDDVRILVLQKLNESALDSWNFRLNSTLTDISEIFRMMIVSILDDSMSHPDTGTVSLPQILVEWIADGIPYLSMMSGLKVQTGIMRDQISNLTREFSNDESLRINQSGGVMLFRGGSPIGDDKSGPISILPKVSQSPAYLQKFEVQPSSGFSVDNVDPVGRLVISIVTPDLNIRGAPRSAHYTALDLSTRFPYETNWIVNIRGNLELTVYDRMSSGACSKSEIHVDIELPITVISGWPIDGVQYERSNTLLGDAGALLSEVKDKVWPYVSPLVEAFQKALDCLFDSLAELSRYINGFVERVSKLLYDFGDWIISKCRELLEKIKSSPLWKFIELRLDLFGNAETRFKYGPMTVIVSCSLPDLLFRKAKDLIRIVIVTDLTKIRVAMGFRIAELQDGSIDIVVNSTVRFDSLRIEMRVDPLMAVRDHLFEIDGFWKGFHLEAWSPEVNDYRELSAELTDIPGLGTVLSNIPVPELGISISINAGFVLKYRMPITDRLSINEVELNPPNRDSGHEWVELYNPLDKEISVEGYTLETMHGEIALIDLKGVVPAKGYRAFIFPHTALDNGNSWDSFAKGDSILLRDASRKPIDVTPVISDVSNDRKSWQRSWDGGPKWVFRNSTSGSTNGNPLLHSYPDLLMKLCMDSLFLAIEDEKENISASLDFVKNLVASFLRELIGQVAEFAASLVHEAYLFIDIGINDSTGSAGGGFRFKTTIVGDLIRQMVLWFAEQLVKIFGGVLWNKEISPNLLGRSHPAEAIFVGFDFYCRIGTPKWLASIMDEVGVMSDLKLISSFSMNLATFGGLFGKDLGSPCLTFGLHVDGLPGADLIEPLTVHSDKVDVWFLRGRLIPA